MAEYVVEILEGPDAGKQFTLPPGLSEVGREAGVAVELANDHLVSRHHARLRPLASGVQVEDLGSANGTFVNGDQIFSPAAVAPGAEITVGVSVLGLRPVGAPAAAETRVVPVALTKVQQAPARPAPLPEQQPAYAQDPSAHGGLARPERLPDYVPPDVYGTRGTPESPLAPLLDKNTKRLARTAPLAIFVLVAFVVIIALALR